MSKSKGIGISAQEVYESLSPEIIRFLMIRHIDRTVDLNLSGMVIPTLYDKYDRARQAYRKEIDFPDLAQTYRYSQVKSKFNEGFMAKFSKIAHIVQMPNIDICEWAEAEKGSKLNSLENKELQERIRFAKVWLEKFAPDDFKFVILDKFPKVELFPNQIAFLKELVKIYSTKSSWSGEDLQNEIYALRDKLKITPKEMFIAIYRIFLDKDSGPQAAWMLASLDYEFVKNRLSDALIR
jgi:lysyl-tRNA synthetase class 1